MKKIPTLFLRDEETHLVSREPNPVCAWVFEGEGAATRKYDGTVCLVFNGKLYRRYTAKPNCTQPEEFLLVDFDPKTRKKFGWMPVKPSDKWYIDAMLNMRAYRGEEFNLPDGTYEIIGPKINGNPEKCSLHVAMKHSEAERYPDAPRTYDELKEWLRDIDIEGLVWHHPDGRMAKIKKRDFGWKR